MKRASIIIFAALLQGACSKDLMNTEPYDAIGSELMWTTERLAEQGVIGVYNVMHYPHVANEVFKYDAFGVSSAHRNGNQEAEVYILMNTVSPASAIFLDYWKQHYEGIHRANDAIANLPNAPYEDSEVKQRRISECKFLRAFCYYKLNMVYQGVPLYLEPVELNQLTQLRAPADSVWQAIIRDLTDCVNDEFFRRTYAKGSASYGRATRGAALALRGKVYLWLKDWVNAERDFRALTGSAYGYQLYPDYKQLFKVDNEQCTEMIFSHQFINQSGWGNEISFRYGSRSYNEYLGGGWNTYCVNTDFVDSYENADGSKFCWDSIVPGYSQLQPEQREVFFFRDTAPIVTLAKTIPSIKQILDRLRDTALHNTRYLPNGNERRLLTAYAARDPRLASTVITPYSTYLGVFNAQDVEYTMRWPFYYGNASAPYDLMFDNGFPGFTYLFRKFVGEGSQEIPRRDQSPIDFPIIRYADVLLGLAEAINEQGGREAEAIAELNKVRNRAGVAEIGSATYKGEPVGGQDDLRERIRNERRWEFAGEGVSYFDELRWRTLKHTKFELNNGLKNMWGTSIYTKTWPGDFFYTWPIPLTQRQMNPALTQNEGWVE
jgi:hypothetical protein